jgi:hypothetical protein
MATKQIALGSLLKVDDGAGFDNQTLVEQITPPPRSRERIDAKILDDTLDVPLLGIEAVSDLEYVQHWEPNDVEHEKLDTYFDSKADLDVQIVTPHTVPVTDEFTCKVTDIGPEVLQPSGAYKRSVTLVRTTDITRT